MGINNGYFTDIGTIWNTCSNDGSIRILYMEAESVYPKNINAGVGSRFQEVGRYYYKADRSTKKGTNES